MRPSLPFVCKSCRTKSKQSASDRGEPRSSPSVVPSSASGRDRREPPSDPERAKPSSGRALEREPALSSDLLDAETTLPGAGIQRRAAPARDPERRAASASAPSARRRGLTLAERIAQQELEDAPASSPRPHALDALDAAAEASLEHAVVTPDGGLGRRDVQMRPRTFAGVSWDDARRSVAAPPAASRSPSALPPADSDPVSIHDLAQMLSPGVEPPSLSFGADTAEDERASQPAPAPEAPPRPRTVARTPVPVRPPARREHRITAAPAATRPRSAAVPRAGASPRPVAPPSEMPPAPLSELPPAPLSIDEGRPSSHRSSPELRLQDVQAMAALAPQPLPSARRARSGPGPAAPADDSPADLALLGSLAPSPTAGPPPLPSATPTGGPPPFPSQRPTGGPPPFPSPPPAAGPAYAAETSRRERGRPKAAGAQGAAEGLREQEGDEHPSREPPARASSAPRATARSAGDRISQTDLRGRAGRKEDSGLIDLRSMAPPSGAEDEARRNEDRADEEILSISGGLFEGATAARSSSPPFSAQPVEPDLVAVGGHTSAEDSGEGAPPRTSSTAGPLLRALSTPASRQYMAIAGWVTVVFVVFGAALYLAQARGRSSSAAADHAAPASSSGALAAAPPEVAPPPAAPASADQATDREPSLDDEPVADSPSAARGVAAEAPVASAAPGPTGEPAAPPLEPAQAGIAPGPVPLPSAAPAVSAASAAAAAPATAAAPAAGAGPQSGEGAQAAERPARAAAPSAPERAKPAAKQPPATSSLLPASDEPARFDQSAATSALASAAAAAAGCTGEGLTGTARVAVTFAPSGKTMSARVEGGDLVGTATAACIAAAFRSATVPPFEGIPVTVMKQVKIR
ncbi:hypothetical protein WMF20_07250 [Sorangium sp. So ce834]|uniref:hypothetical protein n=1 Tax=Sorangium sp. So ce834 TaxID=3133321 RepID=UPI003F5E9D21